MSRLSFIKAENFAQRQTLLSERKGRAAIGEKCPQSAYQELAARM